MSKSPARPEYHAFAAVFAEIGSAIQGTGPTREVALAQAVDGLGSAEGLEVYPVGPRLAALLALGEYAPATPLDVERAPTRLELRLVGEEDEALADVRAAYATGRGLWAGRDWDDADRVCPDTSDRSIVRLARTSDRLQTTAWGISEGADGQPWRNRARQAADRLEAATAVACQRGMAFTASGEVVLADGFEGDEAQAEAVIAARGACADLRRLAQGSDDAVAEDAAAAEAAACEALEAAFAGKDERAIERAEEAARLERKYGDDPTWGALRDAVQRWADLRAAE